MCTDNEIKDTGRPPSGQDAWTLDRVETYMEWAAMVEDQLRRDEEHEAQVIIVWWHHLDG